MRIKIAASRSPWMALPPYQFSWKSTKWFKHIHAWFVLKARNILRTFLPYCKLHIVVAIVTLPKDRVWWNHNNLTIKQSQTIAVQGWKSCLQLTVLNLNHFKMVETMRIKIIASRSPWMASPPYQISWKSTKRFRSYSWGTHRYIHRQTGDLISLLSFLGSRLKSKYTAANMLDCQCSTPVWEFGNSFCLHFCVQNGSVSHPSFMGMLSVVSNKMGKWFERWIG
jgi:hypothetical protein